MSKIVDFFKNIGFMLSFGMKGANAEIMGGATSASDGTTINHDVDDERLSHGLIKGEVNQEVMDLRYRTYKVSDESEKYDYLGEGVAVKNNDKVINNDNKRKISFSQMNRLDYGSVVEGVQYLDTNNRFIFEVMYDGQPRFKIEKYIIQLDAEVDMKKGNSITALHFLADATPDDATTKPFVNELERLYRGMPFSDGFIARSEVLSSIMTLSFSTYKAIGENDYVMYSFVGGAKPIDIVKSDDDREYILRYSWDEFMRVPIDLSQKYYSENMAKKYEAKAPKNTPIAMTEYKKKIRCSICGKEITNDDFVKVEDGVVCGNCFRNYNGVDDYNRH